MVRAQDCPERRNGQRRGWRIVVVTALALAALPLPARADPDPFLARLAGPWIGRGTMQQGPGAAPERVYCKVTNTLSPDGKSLAQDGRCSLPGNSGSISGEIAVTGSDTYTGMLDSLVSRGPATLNGAVAAMIADKDGHLAPAPPGTAAADAISVLQMNADYVDRMSGNPVKALNSIVPAAGGGYVLISTRTAPDGSTYTASRIVFTAK